jgi:glycosyltransferase involved in cell wall biosynthesis
MVVTYEGIPIEYGETAESVSASEEPMFLHIATSHERKGTIYLLRALAFLKTEYNLKPKVVIVGDKDPKYVKMAEDLAVNVDFVGRIADLRPLYAKCTALVVPSVSEGFCLPVIEAATFSKPAIVTTAGSLPELVQDDVDGYVVPVANVPLLAEKLRTLATDRIILEKLSLKAKEKAYKFDIRNVAKVFFTSLQEHTLEKDKKAVR